MTIEIHHYMNGFDKAFDDYLDSINADKVYDDLQNAVKNAFLAGIAYANKNDNDKS